MVKKSSVSKNLARAWGALAEGDPTQLLDDLDLQRATRRPSARVRHEGKRQVQIVVHLRKHLPAGSLVWHTPNHRRSVNHGHWLRSMGQVAGIPDLFVLAPVTDTSGGVRSGSRLFGLEVKDAGARASETQKAIHEALAAHSVPVGVVHDIVEACEFLRGHGVALKY